MQVWRDLESPRRLRVGDYSNEENADTVRRAGAEAR